MPCDSDLDTFVEQASQVSKNQDCFILPASTNALIYFSCLPTLDMTALTNERDFDADDSIPRITWGKYKKEKDTVQLNISLEVNHRLIDGYHIEKFQEVLFARMNALFDGKEVS